MYFTSASHGSSRVCLFAGALDSDKATQLFELTLTGQKEGPSSQEQISKLRAKAIL
jgi:hypothetical protein